MDGHIIKTSADISQDISYEILLVLRLNFPKLTTSICTYSMLSETIHWVADSSSCLILLSFFVHNLIVYKMTPY